MVDFVGVSHRRCCPRPQSVGSHTLDVLDEYEGHTVLRVRSYTVDKHEEIDFVVLQAYDCPFPRRPRCCGFGGPLPTRLCVVAPVVLWTRVDEDVRTPVAVAFSSLLSCRFRFYASSNAYLFTTCSIDFPLCTWPRPCPRRAPCWRAPDAHVLARVHLCLLWCTVYPLSAQFRLNATSAE